MSVQTGTRSARFQAKSWAKGASRPSELVRIVTMSMQSYLKKAQKKQMEEVTKLDPVDPESPDATPVPVKKNPNQMAKSLGGIQKGGGQQQKSTRKKI